MPNRDIVGRYSDFYITDSIGWHHPVMTGLTLELTKPGTYDASVWLDWTAVDTPTQRASK